MSSFLGEYRLDRRQVARLERILAVGRVYLTISALVAIYLDPTEPSRFAALTYALLSTYAAYSIVVLIAIRSRRQLPPSATYALHGVDIAWAAALTFFSEGPISPFFLFFLFVVVAAAYRWGFRETLTTTLVTVGVFLLETTVAMVGPWNRTVFADISFELNPIILRTTYLLLTGVLLGYLADHEKQMRAEMAATTDAMRQPRVEVGLGGSMSAIARLLLRLFDAAGVDVVIEDHEDSRTMLWHTAPGSAELSTRAVRRIELDAEHRAAWLFDSPLSAWCSVGDRSDAGVSVVGLDAHDTWSDSPRPLALLPAFTDAREFQTLAAVDFGLAGQWRGRLFLYDPEQIDRSAPRVQFLASLADHMTPVISNVFLLRRLRSRASAAERARVARELHDGAIQSLIGIEMETEALRRRSERESLPLTQDLKHIQDLLRTEVVALRELMVELRPVDLDAPHHLPDLMAGLIERFRRETGVAARFVSTADTSSMPLRTAIEVARMTQEALANVRKHSRAGNVLVQLAGRGAGWALTVEDDGAGFAFAGRLADAELRARWMGPAMLMERARLIGGEVAVESTPGSGARVEVTFNAR